jgi:hypothetical protein
MRLALPLSISRGKKHNFTFDIDLLFPERYRETSPTQCRMEPTEMPAKVDASSLNVDALLETPSVQTASASRAFSVHSRIFGP